MSKAEPEYTKIWFIHDPTKPTAPESIRRGYVKDLNDKVVVPHKDSNGMNIPGTRVRVYPSPQATKDNFKFGEWGHTAHIDFNTIRASQEAYFQQQCVRQTVTLTDLTVAYTGWKNLKHPE